MSCPKKIGTYLEVHGLKTPFLAVFPDFSGKAKTKVKVQNCTLHFAIYFSEHGQWNANKIMIHDYTKNLQHKIVPKYHRLSEDNQAVNAMIFVVAITMDRFHSQNNAFHCFCSVCDFAHQFSHSL